MENKQESKLDVPVETTAKKEVQTKGSRLIMLAILTVSILPVIISWWMYKNFQDGKVKTSNYGELIIPSVPLRDGFFIGGLSKKDLSTDDIFKGIWTLVIFEPANCDDQCHNLLNKVRQIRLALGNKYMYRVRRLWIADDINTLQQQKDWISNEHPDLIVAVEKDQEHTQIKQFILPNAQNPAANQRIYIVDPLKNIMMSYPSEEDSKHILKDIKRLLLVSYIG
ncbi:SCO family protein [Candidatus Nitrosacidococcus sp. I8]|uniref:SCO family protein n=1 Tax=Candidatus Nitrosacidococcus sp. I8 TaxID=2942908 RepID=UPI0022271EF6|nr:hypothetical protein [Candidatus Nitrosacidococcus sp. I8]CAH9019845.1 hypothetical protein NURINAE_01775 [Candidatus Nitrosacidococcus sp. I8]